MKKCVCICLFLPLFFIYYETKILNRSPNVWPRSPGFFNKDPGFRPTRSHIGSQRALIQTLPEGRCPRPASRSSSTPSSATSSSLPSGTRALDPTLGFSLYRRKWTYGIPIKYTTHSSLRIGAASKVLKYSFSSVSVSKFYQARIIKMQLSKLCVKKEWLKLCGYD